MTLEPAVRITTASQVVRFRKVSGMQRGSGQAMMATVGPLRPDANLSERVAIGWWVGW